MSNTKPVVLKGWVDKVWDVHKLSNSHLVTMWNEQEDDIDSLPATLVIGEEAIPKSEVEKMLREISDLNDRKMIGSSHFEAVASKYGFNIDLSPKSNTQQTEPGS